MFQVFAFRSVHFLILEILIVFGNIHIIMNILQCLVTTIKLIAIREFVFSFTILVFTLNLNFYLLYSTLINNN